MLRQLLMIRHGVTDWNQQGKAQGQSDIPLNEEGRAQSARLARRLRRWPIDALYTSTLSRAAETARIVGEAIGLEPIQRPEFQELDLGELEGTTSLAVPDAFGTFLSWVASGETPGDCERFDDFESRLTAGLARLHEDHPGQTVAVVSHGGALKTLIAHLIGLGRDRVGYFSLHGNANLSIMDFSGGAPKLTLLNDTSHHDA